MSTPDNAGTAQHANVHASALVSPWVNNGNALAYVEKNDDIVNYEKLVHHFLHLGFTPRA